MGCACNKGRGGVGVNDISTSGTYRVMVNGRKVYESANGTAAETVAQRFDNATILAPGES